MSHRSVWMPWVFLVLAVPGKADEPVLTANVGAGGRIATDEVLTLALSRSLTPEEGRYAVLVGSTDWTGLFEVSERSLVFRPRSVPLPIGPTEVALFRVSRAGAWNEVARLPLEVVAPRTFDRAELMPAADVSLKTQFAEGHAPATNAPGRATFEDLASQLSLKTDHARGRFGLKTSFKVVGVSHRPEALRFAAKGQDAPRVDLAGHTVALDGRGVALRLGDIAAESHRYLVSGFHSRGTTLRLGLGGRADLSLGAIAGSKIVGWDNLLGVSTAEHRVFTATLGLEGDPSQPGRLRIEASALGGSVLPVASYNQGVVNDAEESDGFALRLLSREAKGRLRIDGGWARTRSGNPEDALLAQGASLVPVERATADARYVDVKLDVLRAVPLGGRQVGLTAGLSHERVDPLYRSVAAKLGANRLSNTLSGALLVGEAAVTYTRVRAEDNLDHVVSILTTLTRQDLLDLSVPLTVLQRAEAEPSVWLPLLTYQWSRVHQLGDGLPPDSGFNDSHVPDQVNDSHVGSLAWQGTKTSLVYGTTWTRQDNRQPGRETADFDSRTNGLTLGLNPSPHFDLSVEVGFERHEARQRAEVQRLARVGVVANGRLPSGFGVMTMLSHTTDETAALGADASTLEGELQASWRRELRRGREKPALTVFLRCARQAARLFDRIQGLDDDRSSWQLSAGLSLSAF